MKRYVLIAIGLVLLFSLFMSALSCSKKTVHFADPNLEKALSEAGIDLNTWPAKYYAAVFFNRR